MCVRFRKIIHGILCLGEDGVRRVFRVVVTFGSWAKLEGSLGCQTLATKSGTNSEN
jgi:hypothetical protein